jgi:hypothetical protein
VSLLLFLLLDLLLFLLSGSPSDSSSLKRALSSAASDRLRGLRELVWLMLIRFRAFRMSEPDALDVLHCSKTKVFPPSDIRGSSSPLPRTRACLLMV